MAGEGTGNANATSAAASAVGSLPAPPTPYDEAFSGARIKREGSHQPSSAMGSLPVSHSVADSSRTYDSLDQQNLQMSRPHEESSPTAFERPVPEPLTPEPPDRAVEEQLPLILEQLELRQTAAQRYEADADVLAITAARDAGASQHMQIKADMFTLRDIKNKIDSDPDFARKYIYGLGTGQIDAPASFKAHYSKLFKDVVKSAEAKLVRGQKLTKTERYFIFGPASRPQRTSETSLSNGGPVASAGPVSNGAPDGPSNNNDPPTNAGLFPFGGDTAVNTGSLTAPSSNQGVITGTGHSSFASQSESSSGAVQDFSECPDVPDTTKLIECPDVDWTRFGIVGEGLHRIHNTVRASYDRPELRQQLDDDDRDYAAFMKQRAEASSASADVKYQSE